MGSNFNFSCDSQMMQNHLPAALIDAENGFVGVAGQGVTFLFSIDTQSNLWILAECPALQGNQFTMQNVTAEVQAIVPNGTVTAIHAASSNGGLSLNLLVVVQDSTLSDHLIALAGVAATPAALQTGGWMTGPTCRTWTNLAFDPAELPAESFSPLNIRSAVLTSDITITDSGIEYPVAAVVVQTASAVSTAVTFGVSLPPSQTSANLPTAWTYYLMAAQCETLPGYVPGCMERWNPNPGAYELGIQASGDAVLNFVPFAGSAVTPFGNVDPTATAIAALPYTGSDGNIYTDLYVASNGTITLFSWDDAADQNVELSLTSQIFSGVSVLHAIPAASSVLLWGVNAVVVNGAPCQQLFWLEAPLSGRFQAANWSTPAIAFGNVAAVSPLTPDSSGTIDLFVSCPSGQGFSTARPHHGARSSQTADFLRIRRTPDTGTWTATAVTTPAPTDYVTISTYTDRIVLTDANGIQCPQAAVQITAAADATVLVNGAQTQFAAGTVLSVTTDPSGVVTIVHPVSSYAGVGFTVTAPDGVTTAIIDPSTNVMAALNPQLPLNSVGALTALTYPDGNGGNPSVFASDNAQLGNLATVMGTVAPYLSTLKSRAQLQALGIRVQSREDGFLGDLFGDVANLISTAVTDLTTVIVTAAGDIINLTVNLAGEVYNTTIECLEDAITAVSSFFQAVGQDFEAIYNWLAYVFDWKEMVAVHDVLSQARQQSFASLLAGVTSLQTTLDSDIQTAINDISGWQPFSSWGQNTIGQQIASYVDGGGNVNGVAPSSNSMVGWISQRLNDILQSESTGNAGAPAPTDDDFLGNIADQTVTLVGDVAADVLTGLGALANDQPAGPALDTMVDSVGAQVLAFAQNLVNDFAGEVASLSETLVTNGMNQPLDIPIISSLYSDVTNGSTLTILDASCLIEAVLLTVIYNIANPDSNTPADQYIANLPTIMNTAVQTATGASAVLSDSDNAVAEYYDGVILLYKSLYNVFEYLAICAKAKPVAGVFGALSALADITKAILDLAIEGDDAPPGTTGVLFFGGIALLACFVFEPEEGESGFDQALGLNAALNMWLGIGQAVGLISSQDATAADWCEAAANVLDFPNIALANANPVYGLAAAAVRSGAYAYAGITLMNGND